jgi:ABC-2 type transport system permease protein
MRIRIRGLSVGRFKPLPLLLYGLFVAVAHLIAGLSIWGMLHKARPMPPAEAVQLAALMLSFLAFFMLMAAMLGGFRMVLAGRELTLHLSSPVPFARVLWMRVLSLVFGAWTAAILLAAPVADMGALFGHPVFLLIYPVTFGLAIFVTALTLAIVATALRLLGVVRARKVLQLLQAIVPLGFVLLSFARGRGPSAGPGLKTFSSTGFGGLSDVMQWPARAVLGEPLALLVVAVVCTLALLLSVRLVRVTMLAALQQPDTAPARISKTKLGRVATPSFNHSLFRSLLTKEWRTILRDQRLATALLVQPLVVLPFFYLNLMHGRFRLAGAAAAATFVAAQMSQFIANLMISAEEAPALLGSAPVARGRLIRYKCIAAVVPVCLLMLLPSLWLASQDLWIGFICLLCVTAAGFCACAVEVARPYPSPRRSFVQIQAARRKRDPLDILSVIVMQLGWTAGAWFLAERRWWGAAIVFGVLLVPFFEWWRDANRQSLLGY